MPKQTQYTHAALSVEEGSTYAIAGVKPAVLHLAAGSYLFRQGDRSIGIYRLKAGQVSLVRVTLDGASVPMHTAHSGDLFAEASLFSAKYHCDALALCDCEVLIYPKDTLIRQLRERPEELWDFAAELAYRVQGLRTRLQIRQIRSARERVLNALKLKCGEQGIWKRDVTLKYFAEEIGLTHEALYRALASLEREGHILRGKDQIRMI